MRLGSVILSMAMFAAWALVPNYIHLPIIPIMFLFSLFAALIQFPIAIKYFKIKDFIELDIIILGIIQILDLFFLLHAYKNLNVGIASTIHYLGPVITLILAPFILKQKNDIKTVILIIISFLSTILISVNVVIDYKSIIGLIFAFLSSFSLAGLIIYQNKNMKKKSIKITDNYLINSINFVFKFNLYSVILLAIPAIISFHNNGIPTDLPKIFIWGVLIQGVALTLINYSAYYLPAKTIGLLSYTEILWVFIYGIIFLHQLITPVEITGVGIMVLSTLFLLKNKSKVVSPVMTD